MKDLIGKFDSLDVKNTDTIAQADREYCDKHFAFYTKVYKAYEAHLKRMERLRDEQKEFQNEVRQYEDYPGTYVWEHRGVGYRTTVEEMNHLTEHFISEVCTYFEKKYNVSVSTVPLKIERYAKTPTYVTLNDVLEKCVFSSLDGLSFFEKAVEEIKRNAKVTRQYDEYRNQWNFEVKGKTIKFRFNIDDIKPALYFYDGEEKEIVGHYNHNRVENYRYFDNGNTDIKFYTSEFASEFARKYLGYTKEVVGHENSV